MTGKTISFTPELFGFLADLERNNRREWFKANTARYETELKEPALAFIADFAPALKKISPYFEAIPKTVGGSLFRIHRDTRFSHDKTPYKTHCGIHFRHRAGKNVSTPGFYLHLDLNDPFVGVGVWRPDSASLKKIRDAVAADPAAWRAAVGGKAFKASYVMTGDALKRPPRGYDPGHPLIEDLKRKDFTALSPLDHDRILAPGFLEDFARTCRAGSPLVKFICDALGVGF